MKRIILYILAIIATTFFAIIVFVFAASRAVPEGAEEVIEQVMSEELPNQILGDSGRVESNGVELWYESIQPAGNAKGTILLIMGLGGNAVEWPLYFIQPLVDSGYQVIRFDNRGTGLSTWVDEAFTMRDMADDALTVMDGLDVASAHVLGLSMGGMIAQLMAIENPERVQTLISFMSSGYMDDPDLPSISQSDFITFVATGIRHGIIRTERNVLRATIAMRKIMATELSEKRMRTLAEQGLFNLRYRKGFNPNAFILQTQAIRNAGSRYEGLSKLEVPTLVIHGKADPLIPVEHGIKTAEVTPNAELLLIEDMGHDVGPEQTVQIHKAVLEMIGRERRF